MVSVDIGELNKAAWTTKAYEAWLELYGTPEDVARALVSHPEKKLRRFIHHLGDLNGKRVAHPIKDIYLTQNKITHRYT